MTCLSQPTASPLQPRRSRARARLAGLFGALLAMGTLGCGASAGGLPTEPAAADSALGKAGVALVPTRDVAVDRVVGVGDTSRLFADVADGTSFAAANDDLNYVRGAAGAPSASHTLGFSGGPTGVLNQVAVHFRASRGSAQGSAQALVYSGANLVASGSVHALSTWSNFTETFAGLAIPNVAALSVKLVLRNSAGTGALRYTQLWVEVAGTSACVPTTCAAQGAFCGTLPDQCGGTLSCGTCTAPLTCGGAGTPNVCGTPQNAPDGGSGADAGTPSQPDGGTFTGADPVIAAAGDIACGPNGRTTSGPSCHQKGVSDLLFTQKFDAVLTLGDNQYESGAPADFANFFAPSFGRAKPLLRPSVGNHEYGTHGASGYFGYFGAAAGNPSQGYYSYDLGAWHIIALNTNTPGTNAADPSDCGVVSCKAGSAQERWLQQDLAAHPARCTLVYWHHPRFSSGDHGNNPVSQAFWNDLYAANVDVVLNGHDHDYERLAPVDPAGNPDPARGIREFVVGTGGVDFRGFHTPLATSQARNITDFGVLKLTLHATSYDWEFLPEKGGTFSDRGTGFCH